MRLYFKFQHFNSVHVVIFLNLRNWELLLLIFCTIEKSLKMDPFHEIRYTFLMILIKK